MELKKAKEVKPVITSKTEQKQDFTRKCQGLKVTTGTRAGYGNL